MTNTREVIILKAEEIRQGKRAREEKEVEERKIEEMQKQADEQKDEEMKKIEQQTDEQKMMIQKLIACVRETLNNNSVIQIPVS